jgi:hypothetical protein
MLDEKATIEEKRMIKSLYKKIEKASNHERDPTSIKVINTDQEKFILRHKEINLCDGIYKNEINFKVDLIIPKRLDKKYEQR